MPYGDPGHEEELIEWELTIDDGVSRYDDHRERYGDPCPGCGCLRWQGDCPNCEDEC